MAMLDTSSLPPTLAGKRVSATLLSYHISAIPAIQGGIVCSVVSKPFGENRNKDGFPPTQE
jgi:hypothetical protein